MSASNQYIDLFVCAKVNVSDIVTSVGLAVASVLHVGFTFNSSMSLASSLWKIKSQSFSI